MTQGRKIELRGVRVNNLKHVDLDIPHGQWVGFCGPSGSGKTSLALDTLYAEGQRRYIESFSTYTRQFLEKLDKPVADRIDGIPPAISVTASRGAAGNRSIVGTTTETLDYLRLILAKLGEARCPNCESVIQRDSPQAVATWLMALPEGTRYQVGFVVPVANLDELLATSLDLKRHGFVRGIVSNTSWNLGSEPPLRGVESSIFVVVDRLAAGQGDLSRIRESLETAFRFGHGRCRCLAQLDDPQHNGRQGKSELVDGTQNLSFAFSEFLVCTNCGCELPTPEPALFNFNSSFGACPHCEGTGQVATLCPDRIIPDPKKSLNEGAVAPWATTKYRRHQKELVAWLEARGESANQRYQELSEEVAERLWQGDSAFEFGGISGFFRRLEKQASKATVRKFLNEWKRSIDCTECGGSRLQRQSLAFSLGGCNLDQMTRMQICELDEHIQKLEISSSQSKLVREPLRQVQSRLQLMVRLGLGYLTLDRRIRTLSRGEEQRLSLVSALSSDLVNMLYVLDEPSSGLHPGELNTVIDAIGGLVERRNTVVVVEHAASMLRAADRLVEFGPEAGLEGGQIVFDGTPQEIEHDGGSPTGGFLAGKRYCSVPEQRRPIRGKLTLVGARGNNLKDLTVEFPLGLCCLVTGASGSGKSSLVTRTLFGAICEKKGIACDPPLPYDKILGDEQIEDVIRIDSQPIGRTGRSNPITYVKGFDEIRKVFAETTDAKLRNFKPGHFSFNVEGGRCDRCQGDGQLVIDMQFLADVYITCEQCRGQRYRSDILEIKYRGKTIADVLRMTVREAFLFFRGKPKIQNRLKPLVDVGLAYVTLGQPANSLSAGEAQRLKLAQFLGLAKRKRTLFIMDEPTKGLHMSDVVRLLDCFDALLAVGHSLIVIEHNPQMMVHADYLVDLGPGAGDDGGELLIAGTPDDVAEHADSLTGKILRPMLAGGRHD